MRQQAACRRALRLGCDQRLRLVEAQQPRRRARHALTQLRMRHDQRHARIRKHEGKPLARIIRIKRQIGAARLEYPQQPNHQIERALQAQPDNHFRPNSQSAQMMRQLVRTNLQLAVAQLGIAKHNRRRSRPRTRLFGKQISQIRSRHSLLSRIPLLDNPPPLRGAQDLKTADRTLRIANRSRQQPHKTRRQRPNRRLLKQVAGIFNAANKTRSLPSPTPPLGKAQRKVKLRAHTTHRLDLRAHTRQLQRRLLLVLQNQHHLKQRMACQRARRIDNLHQPLKRKVLMRVCRQVAAPNPLHKLAKARIARRVRAQN